MSRFSATAAMVGVTLLASSEYFAAQSLFQQQFTNYSVSLQSIADDGSANFHVTWNGGLQTNFQLFGVNDPHGPIRFHAGAFGSERLFFSTEDFNEFYIVNPRTGQLLDDFNVGGGELSPDSRFIACDLPVLKGQPDVSAVYLLYDLALSPAQNRMGTPSVGANGRFGPVAGWAIYPPQNRSAQTYSSSATVQGSFHRPQSQYFWINNRTLAFVDSAGGVSNAVLVRLGENAHDMRVEERVIDLTGVLDSSKVEAGVSPSDYLRVVWIDLVMAQGRQTMRLTFPDNDRRYVRWSLDVPF